MERTPILLWAAHWTPISGTSCTKKRERERKIKIEKLLMERKKKQADKKVNRIKKSRRSLAVSKGLCLVSCCEFADVG